MPLIPLDDIACEPPGSIGTALDVEVDSDGLRRCGMCLRDVPECKLHDVCPHCKHRFEYFQLLSLCGGLPNSPRSEKALAAWMKRYLRHEARQASCFDHDGPDD